MRPHQHCVSIPDTSASLVSVGSSLAPLQLVQIVIFFIKTVTQHIVCFLDLPLHLIETSVTLSVGLRWMMVLSVSLPIFCLLGSVSAFGFCFILVFWGLLY